MSKTPMDGARQHELLRQVAEGTDAQRDTAVELLYAEYRPRLLPHFFRYLRDKARCEDLLQMVMFKVFKRAAQYDGSSASGWIWTIARNSMKDLLSQLNADPLVPLPDDEASLPDCPPPGWDVWGGDRRDDPAGARHAVDDCVRRQLQAFEKAHPRRGYAMRLAVLEEWSTARLAAYLGRSEGATREFVSQNRKKLNEFMRECWTLLQAQGAGR